MRLDVPKGILVTGGAGFLGSHVCDHFTQQGYQVTCLDNLTTGRQSNTISAAKCANYRFLYGDVRESIKGSSTFIFNFASPASPVDYQRDPIGTAMTNAVGAFNVLEHARQTGARVLQASTSEVYGDPDCTPQSESYLGRTNPLGPRACYNESKRLAETLCADYNRHYGVKVSIFRIFNTYGPRMRESDGRVISNFITAALRGRPLNIYGDGRQTRSFCYVTDFVAACDAIVNQSRLGVGPLNIGNPEEISMTSLAEIVVDLVGSRSAIERMPAVQEDPRQRCPNIEEAWEALAWKPSVSLVEGLRRTIEYFEDALASGLNGQSAVSTGDSKGVNDCHSSI